MLMKPTVFLCTPLSRKQKLPNDGKQFFYLHSIFRDACLGKTKLNVTLPKNHASITP